MFVGFREPVTPRTMSINLLGFQEEILIGLGLNINRFFNSLNINGLFNSIDIDDFFDNLVPVVEIVILFVQLSYYQKAKTILKVMNEDVFIGNGNGVKFLQNYL